MIYVFFKSNLDFFPCQWRLFWTSYAAAARPHSEVDHPSGFPDGVDQRLLSSVPRQRQVNEAPEREGHVHSQVSYPGMLTIATFLVIYFSSDGALKLRHATPREASFMIGRSIGNVKKT